MDHERLKRKMVAVLIADVVGYSRLMAMDEEGTHLRLNRLKEAVIDPGGSRHSGRFIRSMGDGMLVEFDSAIDAVRFAIEVQNGLARSEEHVEPERRIMLRIGINIGDVIFDAKDIYGNSINIAARLEQWAEPGTVYVTAVIYDQLRSYPALSFKDKGKREFKNIDRPIHVFRVQGIKSDEKSASGSTIHLLRRRYFPHAFARKPTVKRAVVALSIAGTVGMAAFPHYYRAPVTSRTASILVLPFRNVSDDAGQNYFADAVTSDVATDLSRIRDVVVISAATAFSFKGKPVDPKQINHDIGVRYLIVGSIRRIGQQINTNIQLIEAASGVQLWGERFDNDFVDLGKLEEGITGRIAASLDVQLVQAEGHRAERAVVPDALDLRLRATSLFFQSVNPENVMAARNLLIQAVHLDPGSAEAWARLGQLTASDYFNHWNATGRHQLGDAEEAVRKALLLDPNLALAHFANGFVQRARGEHHLAIEAFDHAIELNPSFALAYAQKADELILLGRPSEAQPLVERAIKLSPRDPSLGMFYWFIGRANFFAGRYDQAIPWLRKSVEMRPNVWYNGLYLASAYALNQDIDEARKTLAAFNRRFSQPVYTVALVADQETTNPSSDPTVIAARDKFHLGLLRAGMAEN